MVSALAVRAWEKEFKVKLDYNTLQRQVDCLQSVSAYNFYLHFENHPGDLSMHKFYINTFCLM